MSHFRYHYFGLKAKTGTLTADLILRKQGRYNDNVLRKPPSMLFKIIIRATQNTRIC